MGDVVRFPPRREPPPHEPSRPAWELVRGLDLPSLATLAAPVLSLMPAYAVGCSPRRADA